MMTPPEPAPVLELHNESGGRLPIDEPRARYIADTVMAGEAAYGAALLELVYVNETEILRINREYLQHHYVTDIITFFYHEPGEPIEATLYCCAPQIAAQAGEFKESEKTEFERVLIHGLLHACGYTDATAAEKSRMRALENRYLNSTRQAHSG